MLKKFSVGGWVDGWCGRVILVSALSQTKREQRERELDNKVKKIMTKRKEDRNP